MARRSGRAPYCGVVALVDDARLGRLGDLELHALALDQPARAIEQQVDDLLELLAW